MQVALRGATKTHEKHESVSQEKNDTQKVGWAKRSVPMQKVRQQTSNATLRQEEKVQRFRPSCILSLGKSCIGSNIFLCLFVAKNLFTLTRLSRKEPRKNTKAFVQKRGIISKNSDKS